MSTVTAALKTWVRSKPAGMVTPAKVRVDRESVYEIQPVKRFVRSRLRSSSIPIVRPRTRSFGLPTAGLSTANGTFPLSDGAMILLTTAIEADRTGRRYGDKIEPDEPQAATGPGADPIATAGAWLKNASACGGKR